MFLLKIDVNRERHNSLIIFSEKKKLHIYKKNKAKKRHLYSLFDWLL